VNLIAGAPLWLVTLLAVCLVAAAAEDAVRLRISNLTCLAVLIGALVAMAIAGFPIELWQNGVVFALMLAAGTLAFAGRMLGGGDVKLLAALGLWMTFSGAVWLLAAVFMAGGVLAIAFIMTRPLRRPAGGPRQKSASGRIPYGLAIVAGASVVFAMQMGVLAPKPEQPHPFAIRPLSE
jgi:prepilin peptidase CpaA